MRVTPIVYRAVARPPPTLATQSTFRTARIPKDLFASPNASVTVIRVDGQYRIGPRARFFLLQEPLPPKYGSPQKHGSRDSRTNAMHSWVQILSTPTADTPGSCLLFHHDNRRYIFGNLSEGTQRLMTQRKISMSKLDQIFLTGPVSWHTVGGLLGMVLTVADIVKATQAERNAHLAKKPKAGKPPVDSPAQFSIHGGKNLTYTLATSRRFIFRKGLPLRPHEITTDPRAAGGDASEPDWQDNNIMVWYVPLFAGEAPRPPSRKRDHGAMDSGQGSPTAEKADGDRQILESVVLQMFDSDWEMDALIETTLHKVKLPAKLFVRGADGHLQPYDGPLPGETDEIVPDVPVLVRRPWPGATVQKLPRTSPAKQSMCYIVKNHSRRGKFDPKRAKELGIKPPDFKKLTAGENVQGKDGVTVTPDMVIGASIKGRGVAVVDIPDVSYIDAFLARPEWANAELLDGIEMMFWIVGSGVVGDPRIAEFMRHHSSIRHTVSSRDTCPNALALTSPGAVQAKLNRIDSENFPIQDFNNVVSHTDLSAAPFEGARAGLGLQLSPQVLLQDDKVFPFLNAAEALEELKQETIDLADAARAKISDPEFLARLEESEKDIPNRDAEVIPLGTGSAMPSKYRNVSATLVRVPGVGSYLFDCGENTLGSIERLFGKEGLGEVLKDLRVIWLSHLHADHHLGTASVIRAWRDATAADEATRSKRLAVASHVNMLDWLREYADVEDYGYDRLRVVNMNTPPAPVDVVCPPFVLDGKEAEEFGITRIDAARVDHCHGAMATVFSWPSGLKIAYSGDCRPSDAFVQIGKGSTLLIHESTFDDELAGEALAKKHSTMSEALDVGRRMGARRVLLTHFSQRYPKIPVFDVEEHAGGHDMAVLMAFDHMRVRLGDFKKAAAYLPALQSLFNEDEEK